MTILLLVIKVSIVLLAALSAAAILRRSSASTRHLLWSVTFVSLLAVPALAMFAPAIDVPMPAMQNKASTLGSHGGPWSVSSSRSLPGVVSPIVQDITTSDALHGSPWPSKVDALDLLIAIWAVGVVAALGVLSVSLIRVRQLSRQGIELMDAGWRRSATRISSHFGMPASPRLVVSERVSSPMAGGLSTPTVFLPASASEWNDERRDVVLTHEIAHLASRDPLRHLVARVAVACYWFHPLAWIAAARATVSREQACDEAVLAAGTRPSAYARVLLELAESLGASAAPLTALPMAQRSNLEKRVMTILNSNQRPSSTRVSALAAVALGVVTLSVAAARPVAAIVDGPATVIEAPAPQSLADLCRRNGDVMSVGWSSGSMVVQRTFDGMRVCMAAAESSERSDQPGQMLERSSHVIVLSERDGQTQQLERTRAGGSVKDAWRVNGTERAMDARAQEWLASMVAVLDATWEAAQIRGEVSSLRGEISSLRGRESSLRGEISSVRGEVSSINGEISNVLGRESALRGQISEIQGRLSLMRGQVSSEQGAISSLSVRRSDMGADDRRRLDALIDEHHRRIKDLETEIAAFNADIKVRDVMKSIESDNTEAKVQELRKQIEAAQADQRVRAVERNIEALAVGDKVREIEQQIERLNADQRVREIEGQQETALKRLRAAIAAIR